MQNDEELIELGTASLETKGLGGPREDVAIGDPLTGLSDD
jgi:hypothetical protein